MEEKEIEKALYIIDLKIAKEIKENKAKDYNELREKITELKSEKESIYAKDEKIIEKVLNEYIKEVREVE